MHDKRYSVFISSTFEDLKPERQAVQDVIISSGDFPVQMESFPAADEDQFEFIKSLIDKCDYYVLIVAGRYGTPAEDGISYTEKEYRYAASKGLPVLAMIHSDQGNIAANKSEATVEGRERLAAFISTVEKGRLRKSWSTPDALKLAVREALEYAKATKPAIGWVRGDTVTSLELLEELNEVRKDNDRFRDTIGNLEIALSLPPLPEANDTLDIDILPNTRGGSASSYGSTATIRTTWISAFPLFFNNLEWGTSDWDGEYHSYIKDEDSCVKIGSAIAGLAAPIDAENAFKISKTTLARLMSYYIEVGLMNTLGTEPVFTDAALRVSRRHSIAGSSLTALEVVSGSVSLTSTNGSKSDYDDEIPF